MAAQQSLQVNIFHAVYNTDKWLPREGVNAVQEVNSLLKDTIIEDIGNLTMKFMNVHVYKSLLFEFLDFLCEDCTYNSLSYLSYVDAGSLRSNVITSLNNNPKINSYKDVEVSSWKGDFLQSDNYSPGVGGAGTGLEVYTHDVQYYFQSYLDPSGSNNVDNLLSDVNNAFDSISGFEFSGITAVSTRKTSGGAIFIGVNDSSYNGSKYLTSVQQATLKSSIETALQSISGLTYNQVQIISAKNDLQPSDGY